MGRLKEPFQLQNQAWPLQKGENSNCKNRLIQHHSWQESRPTRRVLAKQDNQHFYAQNVQHTITYVSESGRPLKVGCLCAGAATQFSFASAASTINLLPLCVHLRRTVESTTACFACNCYCLSCICMTDGYHSVYV